MKSLNLKTKYHIVLLIGQQKVKFVEPTIYLYTTVINVINSAEFYIYNARLILLNLK